MWWGNQELELQEWEDLIKSKKARIIDIIMLVTNQNPQVLHAGTEHAEYNHIILTSVQEADNVILT